MLKIAVCDDNKEHRKEIKDAIRDIVGDIVNLSVEMFADGSDIVTLVDNKLFSFDLIFLDIKMPMIDGLTVARILRDNQVSTDIIFISMHNEYVYEGYIYKAFSYLIKPVPTAALANELHRYLTERESNISNWLIMNLNGCKQKLNIGRIDYIESEKRKIKIHMGRECFELYSKLDEIENQVGRKFIRTHQSYLVNICKIMKITRTEVFLENNAILPISKKYIDNVFAAFG